MPTLAGRSNEFGDSVIGRLHTEFATLSTDAVTRCVYDVLARARHMGLDATPQLVERVAREHLVSVLKSEPPSAPRREAARDE